VLVSINLRPKVRAPLLPELSVVAGLAAADAVAAVTGVRPEVRFPNDLLIDGRKVAGILAESSEGRVVLGIGVNANQTEAQLPRDTDTEPTSLRVETGATVDRAQLLAAILTRLEHAYDAWVTGTARSG
jgi:BirA family biotin operon repressor/biotin-[acetyl-CoA-carboxylase] ligase